MSSRRRLFLKVSFCCPEDFFDSLLPCTDEIMRKRSRNRREVAIISGVAKMRSFGVLVFFVKRTFFSREINSFFEAFSK